MGTHLFRDHLLSVCYVPVSVLRIQQRTKEIKMSALLKLTDNKHNHSKYVNVLGDK